MNRNLLPLILTLLFAFVSCGKQQTDAERQAEIDRQVQARLETEHQADAQRQLDQRQADVETRERTVAEQENQQRATPAPAVVEQTATPVLVAETTEPDSYSTFYQKLDPYGDWIETGSYGYVFQPRVAASNSGWRPYTDGHWVYTDAGWTWLSAEPFGWATCHYGRWTRLRGTGWVWVPGNEWAPAWVSWRRGNDYVGWAPLPPAVRFERGSGIRDVSDQRFGIAPEEYAFVSVNDFGGPQSSRVIVPPARNVTIISQTTNVTNITYNNSTVVDRGPSYDDLRARSQHQIPRLRLERSKNVGAEKPVIRGDVVAIPARDFRPAQDNARPPRVQRKIEQPIVERDRPEVRHSPPAQPTRPKIPVKTTPARPPVRPAVSASPSATAAPAATPAPTATPPPTATPEPTLNPRQQARRQRMIEQRKERRQQRKNAPAPSPTAESSATPPGSATATPTPSVPPRQGRRSRPQPNQP